MKGKPFYSKQLRWRASQFLSAATQTPRQMHYLHMRRADSGVFKKLCPSLRFGVNEN
jgi:hypothetical protein